VTVWIVMAVIGIGGLGAIFVAMGLAVMVGAFREREWGPVVVIGLFGLMVAGLIGVAVTQVPGGCG
jgi:hypothetical protein